MAATPTRFVVRPDNTGPWHTRQTAEAARVVSSLLQEDLESHHVFFNDHGFHDHIPHHLLSLYGTGAPPAMLQKAYDDNKGYQRPVQAAHIDSSSSSSSSSSSEDWYAAVGSGLLGRQSHYADFLRFFQQEMAADDCSSSSSSSWRTVLTRRLLAGTPAADDLLVRLFAVFLHPLIQLQYGLAWEQPAAVAQGLAQAAVHRLDGLDSFLLRAEQVAAADAGTEPVPTILSLLAAVAASARLAAAAHGDDANKLRDGVLARAADALVDVAARVRVLPTAADIAARTAEMAEACVFVAAAAALHPHKQPRFDFFLIHHVNSIPFFVALNQLDWVPAATKARLLEWKIRLDLAQYAACACPPLDRLQALRAYGQPVDDADSSSSDNSNSNSNSNSAVPSSISRAAAAAAARFFHIHDDGHAIKLVLATGLAEQLVRPFADAPWRILPDHRLWQNVYRLEVESVLASGSTWVRTAGLEEAWKDVPDMS